MCSEIGQMAMTAPIILQMLSSLNLSLCKQCLGLYISLYVSSLTINPTSSMSVNLNKMRGQHEVQSLQRETGLQLCGGPIFNYGYFIVYDM